MTYGTLCLVALRRSHAFDVAHLDAHPQWRAEMIRQFGLQLLGDSTVELQQMTMSAGEPQHHRPGAPIDELAVLGEFAHQPPQPESPDKPVPVVLCRLARAGRRSGWRIRIAVRRSRCAPPRHDRVRGLPHADETGGLSGAPLFDAATTVLASLCRALGGELPVIGVGGITDGAGARAKLDAGASLVQLYSGLVFRGPALVAEAVRACN